MGIFAGHGPDSSTIGVPHLWNAGSGVRLLRGDIAPETLIGLAGWSPPLSADVIDVICHHSPNTDRCATFLTHLTATDAGARVHAHWVRPPVHSSRHHDR